MIGQTSPTSEVGRWAQHVIGLERRIAELERLGQRLPVGARGIVGYAQVTANQTPITSIVDLTGLTVTWTADSARRYKITGSVMLQSNVASDSSRVTFADGSNNIVQLSQVQFVGANVPLSCERSVIQSGLSGSVTRKLRAARQNGTGNVTMVAAATIPAFILVEDIGPAA